MVEPNIPSMVPTNEKFSCFFFEIPKVVDRGCIKIRFDSCSSEVSSVFALSPFSKFSPVLGLVVLVKLGFPNFV